MSLRPTKPESIPAEIARVARAAFPKGTAVMHLRDELGPVYEDKAFADLFGPGLENVQPGARWNVCGER